MKDQDGVPHFVRVVDMTDTHLWRWVRFFRRKWRDKGFNGSDEALDQAIRQSIVTAPAIYAEAFKRKVVPGLADPAPKAQPKVLQLLSLASLISVMAPPVVAPKKKRPRSVATVAKATVAKVEAAPGKRRITLDED